eukprot:TRINITY_DN30806_c0_g1_i1.p1 TRINITY_DN30806_c0_g1~~TRINITY_DN30806_c0_g1_i1.p1  ORF type:complete len:616 (+),score=103.63 TRINITY_DN30806_c0_g1_i1:67-1914(+)
MADVPAYLETMRLLPPKDDGALKESTRLGEENKTLSVALVLITVGFMYSVHNLIAPNMTAVAKLFHFDAFERDAYIGGELTLFFYLPGVFGALLAGVLSGICERRLLLSALAGLTSLICLLTGGVSSFGELAMARATTGFAIGGALPVVYSLVGDWFPAGRRASATGFVSAAGGAGIFLGQCVATLVGSVDWRLPFVVVALPTLGMSALLWACAREPVRGGQEDGVETSSLYQHAGVSHANIFSYRQMRALLNNKTNFLVIIQAFPGNIPWGVIIVYMHDFLVQDLGMPVHRALGAVATLALAAFAGVISGGLIGEHLCKISGAHLAIFGGVCNIARAVPFFIIFGWGQLFGSLKQTSEGAFFVVLLFGGFIASMSSAGTGAMLLNVNLPETRGSVVATYCVLDDISKGLGTLIVSFIVRIVGSRAVAYQLTLLLWVVTGVALLHTQHTYDVDTETMRQNLEEAARESMVVLSKHRAQQAVRDFAKAAGEAHKRQLASAAGRGGGRWCGYTEDDARWPSARQAALVGFWPPAGSRSGLTSGGGEGGGSSDGSTSTYGSYVGRGGANGGGCSGGGKPIWDRDRLRRAAVAAADAMAEGRARPRPTPTFEPTSEQQQ